MRTLERVETLLVEARRLPRNLTHGRLAAESAVIAAIADRLTARLRIEDPIATRVELGKWEAATTALRGLIRLWT